MRLIKLLSYCLLGYVLYELYEGFTQAASVQGGGGGGGSDDLRRALNEDEGRMGALSGRGRGALVPVDEGDGGHTQRVVGRGVVS